MQNERDHDHLQGDEVGHQQLGGDVVWVDEDVELVVGQVEKGAVDADEVEVAGFGGFLQREHDA